MHHAGRRGELMTTKDAWVAFSQAVRISQHQAGTEWRWERLSAGGTVLKSSRGFHTLPECLRDARAHGFTDDAELRVRYGSMWKR